MYIAHGHVLLDITRFVRIFEKKKKKEKKEPLTSALCLGFFRALDWDNDGVVSFQDWTITVHDACCGTVDDLGRVIARMLGLNDNSSEEQLMAISDDLPDLGDSKWSLESEAREIVRSLEKWGVDVVLPHLHATQIGMKISSFLLDQLAPFVIDMNAKLKRSVRNSLHTVCYTESTKVPKPVAVICVRLCELGADNPQCVNFSVESLHLDRDLVEAVANAHMLGWSPVEHLSCRALALSLRTYLRRFPEPLLTIHWSRYFLSSFDQMTYGLRIKWLRHIVSVIPCCYRASLRVIVLCFSSLIHDQKSLDVLSLILAQCIMRTETVVSSTSPIAVELTKVLLLTPDEFFYPESQDTKWCSLFQLLGQGLFPISKDKKNAE